MRLESIPEKSKQIIDALRALIEKDETDHLKIDTRGWQYGGKSFTKLVASLYKETKEDLQPQSISVIFCTVRHFFTGANITPFDLTKGLLVIPISGTSTLSPGGQLPIDTYCYFDNKPTPTLYGKDVDVVFVIYEVKNDAA